MNWNFKSPSMIVVYCALGLCIVGFALIPVSPVFGVVGSVGLTTIFVVATYWAYARYFRYKRIRADQRLSDAYLFAEQHDDETLIKTFTYDKKTERRLRTEKFSRLLVPLSMLFLSFMGVLAILLFAGVL